MPNMGLYFFSFEFGVKYDLFVRFTHHLSNIIFLSYKIMSSYALSFLHLVYQKPLFLQILVSDHLARETSTETEQNWHHKHLMTVTYFHPVVTIGMEAGAWGKSPMMPQLFILGNLMTVYRLNLAPVSQVWETNTPWRKPCQVHLGTASFL